MDYSRFEAWFQKLSDSDRGYLQRQPGWKKAYEKVRSSGAIPPGFVEKTMELLEGGSESET